LSGDPKPNVAEVDANRSARIWNTTDIKTKGRMRGSYNCNTILLR
jgi:hypothetical protein